ncbi:curli production assembly protein CsgB [Stutzerimonas stutzeri]|nr:curli production assembly protein CsgB [Stutzerimonas stutzeri]
MTRPALSRATLVLALFAGLIGAPLHAADLLDNGDLAPIGISPAVSGAQQVVPLSSSQAAYVQQIGHGNLAELRLSGQALNAQILQQGSDQEAFILQHGDNLLAIVEQVGQGNFADIRQTGSDNQASISQYGAYNDARIEQTGSGLRSTVTQFGVRQQINIVQGR